MKRCYFIFKSVCSPVDGSNIPLNQGTLSMLSPWMKMRNVDSVLVNFYIKYYYTYLYLKKKTKQKKIVFKNMCFIYMLNINNTAQM